MAPPVPSVMDVAKFADKVQFVSAEVASSLLEMAPPIPEELS